MRAEGLFIGVEVEQGIEGDAALAARLAEVCPVDIYAQDAEGSLVLVDENLDECVLCRLCLEAAPDGAVRVLKLYDGGAAL